MSNPYPPPNDPGNVGGPADPLRKPSDPNAGSGGSYPPPGSSYPPPGSSYPPPGSSYPPPGAAYPPPGAAAPGPGAYPPPPPGAYPPPAYGQQPGGYPPAPGYGPGGFAPQFNLGDAISYGWNRFASNALSWIVMVILLGVAAGVAYAIGVVGIFAAASGGSAIGVYFAGALVAVVFVIVLLLTHVFVTNGALIETQAGDRSLGAFFRVPNLGAAVGTALLVGVIVAIASLVFYLPGIIAAYLLSYALYFAIARGLSPVESISASFRLVTSKFGDTLLLFIVVGLVNFVGALICGLGLFITVPLTVIAWAYSYKVLTGEPVAPAVQ